MTTRCRRSFRCGQQTYYRKLLQKHLGVRSNRGERAVSFLSSPPCGARRVLIGAINILHIVTAVPFLSLSMSASSTPMASVPPGVALSRARSSWRSRRLRRPACRFVIIFGHDHDRLQFVIGSGRLGHAKELPQLRLRFSNFLGYPARRSSPTTASPKERHEFRDIAPITVFASNCVWPSNRDPQGPPLDCQRTPCKAVELYSLN